MAKKPKIHTIQGTQAEVKKELSAFLNELDLRNLISVAFHEVDATTFSAIITYLARE